MLLQDSIAGEKTSVLIENYAKLLNSGIDSSKILVILQNSNKKNKFIQETLEKLSVDVIEKLQVYSFFGLVYNTILDNWVKVENLIPDNQNTKIIPNLTGLEVSQFIMRKVLSDIKFEGYNSKKSLLHQLFRRYSLIVQNNLSDKDVKWRSEEVLKESFAPDAKLALDEFKKKTLEARALDYLRQSLIFNYIYTHTDYFKEIEYLIVDDGDEITPICLDFIKFLAPRLKDAFIAYDELGSSRSGYLSADKTAGAEFERLFSISPSHPLSPSPLEGEDRHTAIRFYAEKTLNQAKNLRKNTTEPEQIMWFLLRNRNFCDLKFRRQAPLGKYIVDFICLEKKIIVELDGSGHLQEDKIKHDKVRQDFIEGEGYKILRFYNSDVFNNIEGVLEKIYQTIFINDPSPYPLPQGERVVNDAKCSPQSKQADNQTTLAPWGRGDFSTLESFNSQVLEKLGEGSFQGNISSLSSFSKRAQMLDSGISEIKELIRKGIKPNEIAVVTPIIDDMLKFCLKKGISENANLLFLSGSEKIIQNPIVLASLTILKLCDEELKNELSEFDIRAVLKFLQIPIRHCRQILDNFEKTKEFCDFEFEISEYNQKYEDFRSTLKDFTKINKLSEQVYKIYKNLVEVQNYTIDEINKFNFFIKQIEDFESVFTDIKKSEIINQIENSIIAENPYSILEIQDNDLVIATPQKIIDNQIMTKYQFWFDVSSDEWIKNDTGPLYNAWVFQAGWDKPEYTLQDNIELSRQKTARILRKLTLCSNKKINTYASLFDGNGIENFGGIEKYLSHGDEKILIKSKPITPRDDQKSVLDYKKGKMAISAVPGAGKTTILLALIIKLLSDGVNPENIFVLTYMESAARNFRERIQNANQELSQLPNISTIHGLALKILKENANFEKLGLNADFEICDDTQRSRILREIAAKFDIKKTELDDFDRAVSVLKISGRDCTLAPWGRGDFSTLESFNSQVLEKLGEGLIKTIPKDKKIVNFLEFFNEYNKVLQSNNLIDYDDMLLFSVKLLEENPDILAYYQELCHYVIEDEAQDSSAVQQRLIELLSSKHKNLIRCGDVNQAITTTFSNADVEGFRNFIETSEIKVSMNRSQRCTKDVWTLANTLITYAEKKPKTKNAFYKIFMQPVDGKNPDEKNAIVPLILENEFVEKNYILKQIKKIFEKNPKATVGILLRSNYQVANWTKFVNNAGMKTITRSESLEQKGIFRTIFAILKIILNPFNNENIADNYDILAELGHYKSNLYQTIKNCEKPLPEMSADDIANSDLVEFYWDLIYWLSFSSLPVEELAIKIGLYYYNSSDIEKSNVYLISTLIKRLSISYKKYSTLIERLGELAKKPNLSGFKFFSEEDKSDREILEGKVQIMTLHKSKGDEFDYVFLPEMTEKSLPLTFENITLKKNTRFMEDIREFSPTYKPKTDDELKEFLLAENMRLMYVAITRAKRKLYITANKTERYSKVPEPSVMFKII
ncbi:MAG: UvrD-helicase domain-containing protein [Candidatus Gastranaerophilales bacterium]|nr:UvrD-helicase domain-containing protein [Candidatus Gastranaerophilales bacterium]